MDLAKGFSALAACTCLLALAIPGAADAAQVRRHTPPAVRCKAGPARRCHHHRPPPPRLGGSAPRAVMPPPPPGSDNQH